MNKPCSSCENANVYQIGKGFKTYCNDHIREAHCDEYKAYNDYLQNRRKYEPGPPIESIEELYNQEFVWMFGKPMHKGFVHSLQLRVIGDLVSRKLANYAIRKKQPRGRIE